ncbi:MAG: hypothetical protein J5J06_09890 [Phycisphaerae bacterium]|nr:hypothetical protein [Phycisphaerae bacterium]
MKIRTGEKLTECRIDGVQAPCELYEFGFCSMSWGSAFDLLCPTLGVGRHEIQFEYEFREFDIDGKVGYTKTYDHVCVRVDVDPLGTTAHWCGETKAPWPRLPFGSGT